MHVTLQICKNGTQTWSSNSQWWAHVQLLSLLPGTVNLFEQRHMLLHCSNTRVQHIGSWDNKRSSANTKGHWCFCFFQDTARNMKAFFPHILHRKSCYARGYMKGKIRIIFSFIHLQTHKRQVQNFPWQVSVVRRVDTPRQLYCMMCNAPHETKGVIYFCLHIAILRGQNASLS